jgi:hypothetical protein
MKSNLVLTQALATLLQMLLINYGNREYAFQPTVALLQEVSEMVLVCPSMPKVLEYFLEMVEVLYREGFGDPSDDVVNYEDLYWLTNNKSDNNNNNNSKHNKEGSDKDDDNNHLSMMVSTIATKTTVTTTVITTTNNNSNNNNDQQQQQQQEEQEDTLQELPNSLAFDAISELSYPSIDPEVVWAMVDVKEEQSNNNSNNNNSNNNSNNNFNSNNNNVNNNDNKSTTTTTTTTNLAQIYCPECDLKMTMEIAQELHSNPQYHMQDHHLLPCCYFNWSLPKPVNATDGLVQGR